MEYAQLQAFATVLLSICAMVVAIGGATAAVIKFWKWAHRTSDQNAQNMEDVMEWLASDKRRIENLEKWQDESKSMNVLQLKALEHLLTHEVDGNHVDNLSSVRDEIHDLLYKKAMS